MVQNVIGTALVEIVPRPNRFVAQGRRQINSSVSAASPAVDKNAKRSADSVKRQTHGDFRSLTHGALGLVAAYGVVKAVIGEGREVTDRTAVG